MKNILIYFALLVGVCMPIACSSDISEEIKDGSIAGSVADANTGEPVPVVNVSINPGGNYTITGSDGSFYFSNLEPGEFVLTISKEGYKDNEKKIYVKKGEPTPAHILIERIPASITSDKNLLDFGESQTTLSFTIVNAGYTDLEYKVETGNCIWLSVEPTEGKLKYGKTATIVTTINRSKLPKGVNEANIVVHSSSGDGNVEVKVKAVNNAGASVNTLDITNVANTTATFNGEITNAGTPAYTERGFVFDTQSTPSITNCINKLSSPVNQEKNIRVTSMAFHRRRHIMYVLILSKTETQSTAILYRSLPLSNIQPFPHQLLRKLEQIRLHLMPRF